MEGTCFTVCPETSSVEELDEAVQSVWVHPNPSVGQSLISTTDGAHEQGWTLLDHQGRHVREGRGPALQTSGLPAGMYFVSVKGHMPHRVVVR
jgi:hypothetical protein